jgi:hypothetical protein
MTSAHASVPAVASDDTDLTYGFKPSMMSGPHVFRLAPDVLHWEVGRYSGRVPYASIRRIRLSYRPVSLATHRFIAEIWSDVAPKLTVASTSWKSLVEQQRNDAHYTAFVRALNRRIATSGGAPLFRAGAVPLLYWPGAVLCAGLGLGFPWIIVRALQAGALGAAALIGLLMLLFAWQMGNIFWRNRPRAYSPLDIPSDVLPRG